MNDDGHLVQLRDLELRLVGLGGSPSLSLRVESFNPDEYGWGLLTAHATCVEPGGFETVLDATFGIPEYMNWVFEGWRAAVESFKDSESALLPPQRLCLGNLWIAMSKDVRGQYSVTLNLCENSRVTESDVWTAAVVLVFRFEQWHMEQLSRALSTILERLQSN